jgi:tetratricopeptide (TPR) repeat protein
MGTQARSQHHKSISPESQIVGILEANLDTTEDHPLIETATSAEATEVKPPPNQTLWDVAKITSSPTLSTLMDAMKIDAEIPQLLLNDPTTEPDSSYQHSVIRMNDFSNSLDDVNSLVYADNSDDILVQESTFVWKSSEKSRSRPEATGSVLSDFFKAMHRSISPLNRISPAWYHTPPVIPSRGFHHLIVRPKSTTLHEIKIAEQRLQRLEKVLPSDNPGVISAVHALADLYGERLLVEYHKNAELLYPRVLAAKQREFGASHPQTVMVYLDLVQTKRWRGQYAEVKRIHEKIHPHILKTFTPESELGMLSTRLMAEMYFHDDNLDGSERLCRQLLQIALNKLGAKHLFTVETMRSLVITLHSKEMPPLKSLEQFLCTAIQVKKKSALEFLGDTWGYLNLANIYLYLKDYDQTIRLLKAVLKSGCEKHEVQSTVTGDGFYLLCKTTHDSGNYHKAESMLRMGLSWQIRFGACIYYRPFRVGRLGNILVELKYTEEATSMFEVLYGYWSKKENRDSRGNLVNLTTDISHARETLRKLYTLQGLHREDYSFESRLRCIGEIDDFSHLLVERERKWCRFEDDEYRADVAYQPKRKWRGVGWIQWGGV